MSYRSLLDFIIEEIFHEEYKLFNIICIISTLFAIAAGGGVSCSIRAFPTAVLSSGLTVLMSDSFDRSRSPLGVALTSSYRTFSMYPSVSHSDNRIREPTAIELCCV
jgi:hypothetical protein